MYLKLVVHEATREIDDQVEMVKTFDKMETVRKTLIALVCKSNNSVYEVLDGEKGKESIINDEKYGNGSDRFVS